MINNETQNELTTITLLKKAQEYIYTEKGKKQLLFQMKLIEKLLIDANDNKINNFGFYYGSNNNRLSLKKINVSYIPLQQKLFTYEVIDNVNDLINSINENINQLIKYIYEQQLENNINTLFEKKYPILIWKDIKVMTNQANIEKFYEKNKNMLNNLFNFYIYSNQKDKLMELIKSNKKETYKYAADDLVLFFKRHNKLSTPKAKNIAIFGNNDVSSNFYLKNKNYINYLSPDYFYKFVKKNHNYNNGLLISLYNVHDLLHTEKTKNELYLEKMIKLIQSNKLLFDVHGLESTKKEQIFSEKMKKELIDLLKTSRRQNFILYDTNKYALEQKITAIKMLIEKINNKDYYLIDCYHEKKYTNSSIIYVNKNIKNKMLNKKKDNN